jgi:Zn-dependent M16 (insulinase) family peptidase
MFRLCSRRLSSNTRGVAPNLRVGEQVHGYVVRRVSAVRELNLSCVELEHERTGAQHLHVHADDANNLFSVTLKTVPSDSSGVAHILEHVTLCGSHRYPVRDPFFNMLKRSLNTFMNAWTASDHTSYPFSTQNAKDYANLTGVYLDAVFNPLLDRLDFLQEGHRFAFRDQPLAAAAAAARPAPADLEIHGVVYNEMKGAMSDPQAAVSQALDEALFPTTTYRHNSGGAPAAIPDLTHEQLVAFHARHYHPSNAKFVTYGDLPLAPQLAQINESLARFSRIDPRTDVPNERRLAAPVSITTTCPVPPSLGDATTGDDGAAAAADSKEARFVVAWLARATPGDEYESFAIHLLSSLLLSGSNAPMYKALIESGLAATYSVAGFDDRYHREGPFMIGLTGVDAANAERISTVIAEVLDEVARDGFPSERIEAQLHQLEVALSHKSTRFGMSVFQSVIGSWLHGGDAVEPLRVTEHVERFRRDLAAPGGAEFFQRLVRRHLIDNPHRVTLLATPDAQFGERDAQLERERLERARAALTPAQIDAIVAESAALRERQDTAQDVSVLPTLTRDDIVADKAYPVLKHFGSCQTTVQPTGGMSYVTTAFGNWGVQPLPDELLPFAPLFSTAMSALGTDAMTHRELAQAVDLHCGSFGASIVQSAAPAEASLSRLGLTFDVSALPRNVPRAVELMRSVLTSTRWHQPDQLRVHVTSMASSMRDGVAQSGHSYARRLAASRLGERWALAEKWSGLSQIAFLQSILADEKRFDSLGGELARFASHVVVPSLSRASIVAPDDATVDSIRKLLATEMSGLVDERSGVSSIPPAELVAAASRARRAPAPRSAPLQLFVALPLPVNYTGLAIEAVSYTDADHAALTLLAQVLRVFLHPEIREKGGAYGGGAFSDIGLFGMYSYRDPHIERTLDAFRNSVEWAEAGRFSDQDLHEALLSVMGSVDAPVAPSRRGSAYFHNGLTDDDRRTFRARLLAVTRDELIDVCRRRVGDALRANRYSIAVLGNAARAGDFQKLSEWEVKQGAL